MAMIYVLGDRVPFEVEGSPEDVAIALERAPAVDLFVEFEVDDGLVYVNPRNVSAVT